MSFVTQATDVYSAHLSDETQVTAVDAILESLLDVEFVYSDGKKREEDIDDEEVDVWRTAVVRIARQLLIFGYCLCRVVHVRPDKKDEVGDDDPSRYRIEVACGTTIVPNWNRETLSWNFHGLTTGTKMNATKNWVTLVYTEPMMLKGQPLLRSGAARAYELTRRLAEMEQNQAERDRLNSLAVVVTERANTGGHAPDVGRNPELTLLYGQQDTDVRTWAYHQKELMVHLADLSQKSQDENRRLYESSRASKRPRVESNLMQLPVAQGQTGSELSVRHGPPDYSSMIATLKNDIFWCYNVPPLIKAMKATSERTSSADRMMQVILTDWDRFIRHMRSCIGRAIKTLSREMTGTLTYVHMRPRMSAFCLQQIRDIMHLKPMRTAIAAVYNVDESVIDPTQLRLVRQLETEGAPENRKQNAHDVDGGGKGVASDAEKSQSHTLKHTS